MSTGAHQGIGGLLWYAECKKLALEQVMDFRPPADSRRMGIYHGLYLANLLSLLELAVEMFGSEVERAWEQALDGQGGQSGANNAAYVRELRNSVVHRGANLAAAGIVVDGRTCALSPPQAFHRRGRKGPFAAFAPLLRNVFALCEEAIGPVVLAAAADALAADEDVTVEEMKSAYLQAISVSLHMPAWAKELAARHVDEAPFEQTRGHQARRLRDLLEAGAPAGLPLPL